MINKFYFGNFFYFFTEKISFNATKQLIFPFKETYSDFLSVFKDSNFTNQGFMTSRGWNAIFTLFASAVVIFGVRKINWIYSVYAFGSILMFASLSWGISNARYTLAVFPIFIVLALIENKTLQVEILTVSALMLLYFTQIFTGGAWAF